MPKSSEPTRLKLLAAASALVAEESLAQLNIENIADKAGVSRRTFFQHFPSKDHMLAAVIEFNRPAYLDRYKMWADNCGPAATIDQRIASIFNGITGAALNPNWKGCCFIRMAAELGSLQGHPVHLLVAAANHDLERWLETELAKERYQEPAALARQLVVLINGLLMMQLVTHSTAYGQDVSGLVTGLLEGHKHKKPAAAA
jgi:AcrR family transcriptional regulator